MDSGAWIQVLKKNLFSVYLAADDQDESEISFGEWGSPKLDRAPRKKMCFIRDVYPKLLPPKRPIKTILESIYRWYMLVYISGTLPRVLNFSF